MEMKGEVLQENKCRGGKWNLKRPIQRTKQEIRPRGEGTKDKWERTDESGWEGRS